LVEDTAQCPTVSSSSPSQSSFYLFTLQVHSSFVRADTSQTGNICFTTPVGSKYMMKTAINKPICQSPGKNNDHQMTGNIV
jgi:hypothetical protein